MMNNADQYQNSGNIRKGLGQSMMMKSLMQSNSHNALWKGQSQNTPVREELAELAQKQPPLANGATNDQHGLAGNNFKHWMQGGR